MKKGFMSMRFFAISMYGITLDRANIGGKRQRGESQNECFKKEKPAKFSEKRTFLTP